MFNYNNLKVSLRVSPAIAPSNFYTKEESDVRFVKDVPEYTEGTVYGRARGEWVKIDSNFSLLHTGFSVASTTETLVADDNFEKLDKFAFAGNTGDPISDIKVEVTNPTSGYVFWICSERTVSSVSTIDGLPINVQSAGTFDYKGTTYNAYKLEGLKVGKYTLNISVNAQIAQ